MSLLKKNNIMCVWPSPCRGGPSVTGWNLFPWEAPPFVFKWSSSHFFQICGPFWPPSLLQNSKPITSKKSELSCAFGTPPAEEGPVSQDGTSFPERHHLFFQLITPVFFRFVALFGHFFPKSTSRRFQPVTAEKEDQVLKNETFSLSLKGPPCMEICIQIIYHQGCLFVFFQMVQLFSSSFSSSTSGRFQPVTAK